MAENMTPQGNTAQVQAIVETLMRRAAEHGDNFEVKNGKVTVRCLEPGRHKNRDDNNSAVYTLGKYLVCKVCELKVGERQLAERLGIGRVEGGLTLDALAVAKMLPVDFLVAWGWRTQQAKGKRAAVHIPWYDSLGVQKHAPGYHRRHYLNKGDEDGPRFTWDLPKSTKLSPYGAWRISEWLEAFEAQGIPSYCWLCESETDAVTFWLHGIPAIAYGGTDFWRKEWAKYLTAFHRVLIAQEPDPAGQRAADRIALELSEELTKQAAQADSDPREVLVCPFPEDSKDANALHQKVEGKGSAFREFLREIANNSSFSATDRIGEDTHSEEGLAFLREPKLFEGIGNDLETLGVVGEKTGGTILYLVGSSRKMRRPLGSAVRNPSSYGKTHLVTKVAALMPEDEVIQTSRLTPQALHYWEEGGLRGKWLVILDTATSESMGAARIVFSDGGLRVYYPAKDEAGNLATTMHQVEGPVAYTDVGVTPLTDVQDSSRFLELPLDGSQAQTERIQDRQRWETTLEGIRQRPQRDSVIRRHQAAQRLLEPGLEIIIPFAPFIKFPSNLPRSRRDLARFLNLIQAVAFLRQFQKTVHEEGGSRYVEADLGDYRIAYDLFLPLAQAVLNDLNAHSLSILGGAQRNFSPGDSFTRQDLVAKMNVRLTFVRDYVGPLVEGGFLEVVQVGDRGKPWFYKLAGRTPDVLAISTPDEVADAMRLAETLTSETAPSSSPVNSSKAGG